MAAAHRHVRLGSEDWAAPGEHTEHPTTRAVMTDRRPDGLLRAGALLSSTALLSAGIGLIRSKIIALAAGPSGVGILAQMNQVAALVGAFCSLGLGVVAVTLIAQARERGDLEQERRIIALLLGLPVLLSVLLLLPASLFLSQAAGLLLGDSGLRLELLIALVSVPFNVLSIASAGVLLGWGRGGALSGLTLAGAVLGTVFTVGLVVAGGTEAVAWTVLATSVAPIIALAALQPRVLGHLSLRMVPDDRYRALLRAPAAGMLINQALLFGSETVTRAIVLRNLGAGANGLFQPVSLLRTQLLTPLVAGIAAMLLPSLSRLIAGGRLEAARAELRLAWRVILLFIVPVCLLLVGLRKLYIFIAFSSEFLPGAHLVLLQMPGEVLMAVGLVLNAALLPAGRSRWYVGINIAAPLVQVGTSVALLPGLGLPALIVGFTAANAVTLALQWRALAGTGLRPDGHLWMALVGVLVVSAAALAVHLLGTVGEVAACAAAVAWPFLVSSHQERTEAVRRVRNRFRSDRHAVGPT